VPRAAGHIAFGLCLLRCLRSRELSSLRDRELELLLLRRVQLLVGGAPAMGQRMDEQSKTGETSSCLWEDFLENFHPPSGSQQLPTHIELAAPKDVRSNTGTIQEQAPRAPHPPCSVDDHIVRSWVEPLLAAAAPHLTALGPQARDLLIATGCSGTGSVTLALKALPGRSQRQACIGHRP
jgi:hypothetical protein